MSTGPPDVVVAERRRDGRVESKVRRRSQLQHPVEGGVVDDVALEKAAAPADDLDAVVGVGHVVVRVGSPSGTFQRYPYPVACDCVVAGLKAAEDWGEARVGIVRDRALGYGRAR